jgi:Galactose oxidase, central domain/Kelch motif
MAAAGAAPNTWAPGPPLDKCSPPSPLCAGRHEHAATLLKNGMVLVVGGSGAGGGSAQLFDPAKGTWSATEPLREPSSLHTATLLTTGYVLVVSNRAAQLYDPEARTWQTTPPLPGNGHGQHTATLLPNGKVLVAGGLGDRGVGTNAVSLYDVATNTWSPGASLIQLRFLHRAVLLRNGKVLVAGGYSENYGPKRNTAELYDPATNTWSPTGSLATSPIDPTMTLLPDGKVLLAGGESREQLNSGSGGDRTAQLYDPERGAWSPAGSMNSGRSWHSATLLPNGTVLVVGGTVQIAGRGQEERPETAAPAELYDPAKNTWSRAAPPRHTKMAQTATLLPRSPASVCGPNCGKVLVAGGRAIGQPTNVTVTADFYESPPGTAADIPGSEASLVSQPADDDGSGLPIGLVLAAVGLVVVGVVVAVALARRRRTSGAA